MLSQRAYGHQSGVVDERPVDVTQDPRGSAPSQRRIPPVSVSEADGLTPLRRGEARLPPPRHRLWAVLTREWWPVRAR